MSVAYPVRGLHGPIPLSAGLLGSLRASQTLLSYRGFISRRGARTSAARGFVSQESVICLLCSFLWQDRRYRSLLFRVLRVHGQLTHQTPVFLFVPSPPPRLACPSLTRPPARCFSCALRDFAALLFRFLPEEISRAQHNPRRGFGPCRARFLPAPSQKAPLALGSRAPRVASERVSRVRSGQSRFGG